MVCSRCESKLSKLAAPDPYKEGARNTVGGRDGGRLINENKALSRRPARSTPYSATCGVCKQSLHQQGLFCQTCAYAKGVCAMCGVQILDTTMYRQSGGGNPEADATRMKVAAEKAAAEAAQEEARNKAWAAEAKDLAAAKAARGAPPVAAVPGGGGAARLAPAEPAAAAVVAAAAAAAAVRPQAQAAAAAAAELVSIAVRRPPAAAASLAQQQQQQPGAASLVGGTLASSLGAAGRPRERAAADDANAGAPPPGWPLDPSSGLHYDVASQQYWSPQTRLYFDCGAQAWSALPKGGAAAGRAQPQPRVPDRWGL